MKLKNLVCIASILAASLFGASAATTNTLAGWKFDGLSHAAPYNAPSPTTGVGTASILGMTNSLNGVSTAANADLLATNGASTGTGSVAWRIQSTPNIGWSTNAPVSSQGVQFTASTVGYYQVKASFDVYATNGAERYLQVQYTIDNGTNWYNATNATSLTSGGKATVGINTDPNNSLVLDNYLILTNGWNNGITLDLTGNSWVANNPNFGIRLVNAATGTNCLTVSGTNYNNTSGYWGFDNVVISGVSLDTAALFTFEKYAPVGKQKTVLSTTADTGTGTGIVLGMDNSYNSTSCTNGANVMGQGGSSSNPNGSGNLGGYGTNCWRIVALPNTATAANGWSSQAPLATQGAEFDVPTTAYTNVLISFDLYLTTQAEAKMCVQYSTDGGTTWVTPTTNLAYAVQSGLIAYNTSSASTVTGAYFYNTNSGAQGWYNYITLDLSSVPAASRNANFKFRVVNAATGLDCVNNTGGSYNNSSGNCRFDNVLVAGTYTGLPAPVLAVVNPNATVDTPFTNTFTDNPTWRAAITSVQVNGQTLTNTAYTITAGKIVFNEANSVLLQSSGAKNISIIATGYSLDKVTQPLAGGLAVKLAITAQPAGPSASGGTLVANPALAVTDQYGNGTATAPNTNVFVSASVGGGGAWTLGGGTNQASVNGYMIFSNLTATVTGSTAVTNVYITFTVSNYNGVGSPVYLTNSSLISIGAPTKPFTPGNLAVLQLDTKSSVNTTFSVIEVSPSIANQTSPVSVTPISATGTNALRSANAGSIGRLSLSDDGTLLCFAAFPDDSSTTVDETLNLNRAVGTLNYTNQFTAQVTYVSTSTGGSQPRSCTTFDDVNFIVCDKAFLYYGSGSSGAPFNFNNNVVVRAFGGHGYVETQKTSDISPYNAIYGFDVIDGNPTYNASLGYPLPNDQNAQDFYMISTNGGSSYDVLYILDAVSKNNMLVITKYSRLADGGSPNGYSWTSNGSITNDDIGDSLFATTNGSGGVYLYYTTAPASGQNNSIVQLNDSTGFNGPLTITSSNTIYTASGGVYLKGITFVPQQAGNVLSFIPPPLLTAQNGASVTNVFCVTNTLVDPAWHAAITGITVNGSALSSAAYDTTQAGWIAFNPSVSTLLQGSGPKNIVISATGYSSDSVVQPIAGAKPTLGGVSTSSGQLHFTFTSATNLSFSVHSTSDITVPLAAWPVIGTAVESPVASGQYQFTDPSPATNNASFYILTQP